MKKILKKKEGFTLVELIVVIAILAILAAVAIPAYSGYITKAHEAADLQQLDAVLTAVQFATVDANNTAVLNEITKYDGTGTVTVSCTVATGTDAVTSVDISTYLPGTYTFKSTTFTGGAKWTPANGWEKAN